MSGLCDAVRIFNGAAGVRCDELFRQIPEGTLKEIDKATVVKSPEKTESLWSAFGKAYHDVFVLDRGYEMKSLGDFCTQFKSGYVWCKPMP